MKNKKTDNQNEKIELAKKIASQSKRVSDSYNNFESSIFRLFKWFSSLFDQIVFNDRYVPFVTLGIALIFYFSVNYNNDNNIFNKRLNSAKNLNAIAVNANYNSESFEIIGVPETCDITIVGEAAEVNNASSKKGYCLLNLDGYVEGTHQIKTRAVGYGDNVEFKINPSTVTVTLKKKTTGQFVVGYDYINTDKLESKYTLGEPSFENSRVNIRASQDTLDTIAFVKALINVEGITGDFNQEASLVAYNKQGLPVVADIVPDKVNVSVKVSTPNKTVPIILNVTGSVPNDMAIDSIYMDHQSVVVYAPESVLGELNYVTVNVDASTLTKDTKIIQPITLPNGAASSDVTKVNLDIKLAKKETKVIEKVPISYENHNGTYNISVLNNQANVNVVAVGTKNNLDAINVEDINVYFDLKDVQLGTYDVPLQVNKSSNPYVTFTLNQKTLNITLTSNEDIE